MQRHCKNHYRKNYGLNESFPRMECVGGPRRWISRLMMNPVNILKETLVVHQPMCPIEIKIMKKQGQNKAYKQVSNAIIADVIIDKGYPCTLGCVYTKTHNRENNYRTHGVSKFLPQLNLLWKDLLY